MFTSFDETRIAFLDAGAGRPALLLHGFLFTTQANWIEPGIVAGLTQAGRRVIAPDLRGHGASGAGPMPWPMDAHARDAEALLAHLQCTDFDLVGYSLGARIAVRLLARGARPRRCILGGMGESVTDGEARRAMFRDLLKNGASSASPRTAAMIEGLMAQSKVTREAALASLDTQIDTPPAILTQIPTPILCLAGHDDHDNGAAEALADFFPDAHAKRTPGNHLNAVASPDLLQEMLEFLSA